MQEVTQKIQELYSLLESKISNYEAGLNKISERKDELVKQEEVIKATKNRLSAMERIYKKYEDIDVERKKLEEDKIEFKARIKKAEEQEKNDAEVLAQIQKERAELDKKKEDLNRQGRLIKEQQVAFDKKREELKGLINGQAIKDMFK